MSEPSLSIGSASERKRAIVVHANPTAGYQVADRLATHGYETILARHIEEVQPDLPHIRPDVIVVDLHPSAKPALPYFQSVCPLVPIIAMMRPGHFSRESGRDVQANACGAGVFVCESPDRERHSAHPQ